MRAIKLSQLPVYTCYVFQVLRSLYGNSWVASLGLCYRGVFFCFIRSLITTNCSAGYIDQLTKSPRQRTGVRIVSDRSASTSEIRKTRSGPTVRSAKLSEKNTRRKSLGIV